MAYWKFSRPLRSSVIAKQFSDISGKMTAPTRRKNDPILSLKSILGISSIIDSYPIDSRLLYSPEANRKHAYLNLLSILLYCLYSAKYESFFSYWTRVTTNRFDVLWLGRLATFFNFLILTIPFLNFFSCKNLRNILITINRINLKHNLNLIYYSVIK